MPGYGDIAIYAWVVSATFTHAFEQVAFVTRQSVWYLVHNCSAKEYYMNNENSYEKKIRILAAAGDSEECVCHSRRH